ncbi:globin domain-containing protein [Streptomyces boninensis]|uniref:globin domain-containing protein n=1 Tax=Streptomyces boninensis TaxID=2039455 RepID=UPI003B214EC1
MTDAPSTMRPEGGTPAADPDAGARDGSPPRGVRLDKQGPADPPPDAGPADHRIPTGTAGAIPAADPPPPPEPSPDALRIRRTLDEIAPIADRVTSYFYALLFIYYPDLRVLFPGQMDVQRDRLFKALLTAAEQVDNPQKLAAYLAQLGRGHRKYGTRAEYYPAVGDCLLAALAQHATCTWDEDTEAAWVRAYTAVSQTMIDAAAEDERHTPPWWLAEVVSHDQRTADIAIITVRPDQHYPFTPGQYAAVETPWWPRVWRHYSFACAPRADNLLSFHIRAVPAGWVSNALVHRARPGDVIRLGPATGNLTVDHDTDNALLCLGGGTGIAPIRALVEDVARHTPSVGWHRRVELFYGARRPDDLYDMDTLRRWDQAHPWLTLHPVVGDLPAAVGQHGPWPGFSAYLAGPLGMIRGGVEALTASGIPAARIRHDSLEELLYYGT